MSLFDDDRFESKSLFEDELDGILYDDERFEDERFEDEDEFADYFELFEIEDDSEEVWLQYERNKRLEEELQEQEDRMYNIIAEEEYRYYEHDD